MPVTIESRNELVSLFIGMFNAAPGAPYLNALVSLLQSGKAMVEIANTLATRSEFTQTYPVLSADEFSNQLASNLLGSEVSTVTAQWAKDWVSSQLAAGTNRATVISTAVHALQSSSNPDFANAKAMLANKVDVALYYSVTKQLGSTSLATLQAVIEGVTSDVSTVVSNKSAIDEPFIDLPGRTYTLTTGVDLISSLGASNDVIYANGSNLLSAGNSIDGGAGTDALIISAISKIDVPTSVTVKNVETVTFASAAGVSGDVSGWAGLTDLRVTSTASDVVIKAANTTAVNIVVGGVKSTSATAVNVDVSGGGAINITTDSSVFTTIANPHAGMTVNFALDGKISSTFTKVSLAAGAALQDYLDAAAAGVGSPETLVTWFQYDGNTFVVEDNSAGSTYVNGADAAVKLIGLIDLGAAHVSAIAGKSASFALT